MMANIMMLANPLLCEQYPVGADLRVCPNDESGIPCKGEHIGSPLHGRDNIVRDNIGRTRRFAPTWAGQYHAGQYWANT